jgi:hypothetical protein
MEKDHLIQTILKQQNEGVALYVLRHEEFKSEYLNECETKNNNNALLLACFMHFDKLAIELVESGIDISYQNKKGLNALMYAIIEKQSDLIQALINHKDIKVLLKQTDIEGHNALIYSLNRDDKTFVRNTSILSTLLKHFEFDKKDIEKALAFSQDIKHFRAQEILKEYLQKPQNDQQLVSQSKKLVA